MNVGKIIILVGLAVAVFGLWKSNQADGDTMAKVRQAKADKAKNPDGQKDPVEAGV